MSSIINQEREEIISDINTAQESLRGILEKLNRGSQILRIREVLYGDLDFSILSEYGFEYIQYITIEKGKITSITGLPKGLRSLICPGNLLIEITDLPTGLVDINLEYNYLTNIDLGRQVQLEYLNVSHNQVTTLKALPKTLATLKCNHNKLARLDLRGLDRLEHLHVSNNPITIIENLPDGIPDFQMENTPGIQFRNFAEIPIPSGPSDDSETEGEKRDYKEALNLYFKMKTNYENEIYRMKKKVYSDEPNKKIAKKKLLEIKPKCINCKRPVGTTFSAGKKDDRYTVTCGDPNPGTRCKLDIVIFNGDYSTLEYALQLFKDEVDSAKDTIIEQKLNTLFNYVSEEESVKLFKQEIQAYTENSDIYKMMLDNYNNVYNNSQKRESIIKKLGDIFRLIETNRELLVEYNKTQNPEILKTAMDIQVKEITPEIRNLRMLKHEIMEMDVEHVGYHDEHILIRYPMTLDKIEYLTGEPPRVQKFSK